MDRCSHPSCDWFSLWADAHIPPVIDAHIPPVIGSHYYGWACGAGAIAEAAERACQATTTAPTRTCSARKKIGRAKSLRALIIFSPGARGWLALRECSLSTRAVGSRSGDILYRRARLARAPGIFSIDPRGWLALRGYSLSRIARQATPSTPTRQSVEDRAQHGHDRVP
eukprot:1195589-Prorocentrum_minimum.AAC.2